MYMCVQGVITDETVQQQGNQDGVCLHSFSNISLLTCFIQHVVGFCLVMLCILSLFLWILYMRYVLLGMYIRVDLV